MAEARASPASREVPRRERVQAIPSAAVAIPSHRRARLLGLLARAPLAPPPEAKVASAVLLQVASVAHLLAVASGAKHREASAVAKAQPLGIHSAARLLEAMEAPRRAASTKVAGRKVAGMLRREEGLRLELEVSARAAVLEIPSGPPLVLGALLASRANLLVASEANLLVASEASRRVASEASRREASEASRREEVSEVHRRAASAKAQPDLSVVVVEVEAMAAGRAKAFGGGGGQAETWWRRPRLSRDRAKSFRQRLQSSEPRVAPGAIHHEVPVE
ncbi:unnamed protein product [Symbiodinium sp. CCMP2456]|nr:unnamed protein product [Symbiodinium sp. CCMP2456]